MAMLSLVKTPLRAPSAVTRKSYEHSSDEEQVNESKQIRQTQTNASELPLETNDESLHDSPAFRHHAEATSNELFYDLFFVANLTTFSGNHEINSHEALASYIGFFSVLWFTWYQVSLYDVRFAMDSVFDRVCKALQFGVMVGFAVIGPQYDPVYPVYKVKNFRAMALLLMASRIVLCFQYGMTFWFTRKYLKTRLPLLLIIASTAIAAIIFAAIVPAFPKELDEQQKSHTYIAFYVVAVCETLVTTVISCSLRVVSFKGTHLVQRMSLLTLIILGEGVILLTKSIAVIVKNYYLFDSDTIGQIISSVLIIYFFYMLYFDRCETEKHFGTIRQQIWSFLHFPLHLAIVLAMEGTGQNIVWHQAITGASFMIDEVNVHFDQYQNDPDYTSEDFVADLNSTAQEWFSDAPKGVDISENVAEIQEALETLEKTLDSNATSAVDEASTALQNYELSMVNTVLESLKLEAPEAEGGEASSPEGKLVALAGVYDVIFVYFFVAAGLALVLMEVLGAISRPPKTVTAYLRTIVNLALGVGLCLLSTMELTNIGQDNYMGSAWVLPTLCLTLLLALVVLHLRHFRK